MCWAILSLTLPMCTSWRAFVFPLATHPRSAVARGNRIAYRPRRGCPPCVRVPRSVAAAVLRVDIVCRPHADRP
ncbi:hypothetical protein B0H14DRAFT_2755311, partial [Mycena olivaceomarginata]